MANVKTRANIREQYDVQDIVTSVILSAECALTAEEITSRVIEKCEGGIYPLTRDAVHEMVEDTLTSLQRVRAATCYDDKYYAYPNMGVARLMRRGEI